MFLGKIFSHFFWLKKSGWKCKPKELCVSWWSIGSHTANWHFYPWKHTKSVINRCRYTYRGFLWVSQCLSSVWMYTVLRPCYLLPLLAQLSRDRDCVYVTHFFPSSWLSDERQVVDLRLCRLALLSAIMIVNVPNCQSRFPEEREREQNHYLLIKIHLKSAEHYLRHKTTISHFVWSCFCFKFFIENSLKLRWTLKN